MQRLTANRQVPVGRDHVDVVRLDPHFVHNLDHRHRRVPVKQFRRKAFVHGGEVLDEHEGHARVAGHVDEQLLEGIQAASRRPDADHD
jgi:hypothetical protein